MRKISTTKNNNPTDIKVNNIPREQLEQGTRILGRYMNGENMRNNKNQIKHGAETYGIALKSRDVTGGAFSLKE